MITEIKTGWATLPPRVYGVAALSAVAVALVVGIPTDVVPNPWFTRMTPVRPLDVVFLVAISLLSGAVLGTYVRREVERGAGAAMGSGLIGVFAVGCPVCNKLVVMLLGLSGATTIFAPIQPLLGAAAVALSGIALVVRLRRLGRNCVAPSAAAAAPAS